MLETNKKGRRKHVWIERDKYYEGKGYACEEIGRMREMERGMKEELSVRDKDMDKQERRSRISESRYNAEYRKIVKDEVRKYTHRESIKEKRMMARFRCGNEEKENNFWMDETDRKCRICWREGETIEHMLEGCEGLRELEESRGEVLNEDGRGLEWMKEVRKIMGTKNKIEQLLLYKTRIYILFILLTY
ncbi:hypothetical protein Zmor_016028 [Zophobas morio]|uniref:Uncharacterized protein n=1 Tax=Zophobas morio TaxID=2755281 RepID=A0AA38MI31_9CUCU|nr:hypothetical protein Zmor_016028 [Zophobas morio]